MTSTRIRTLTALATTMLVALPLAACGGDSTEDPTATASTPAAPTTTSEETTPDPAAATPQERIEAYFAAADANAEQGWPDSSYVEDYLTPEMAEGAKKFEEENAESGAKTSGERVLSDWRTVEETETTATIEFCDDVTGITATKDGEPYELENPDQPLVAQYKLIRADSGSPWLIDERGYYRDGTTCDAYFAD